MDLYITHIQFLPIIGGKEIEKILEQGNRMLLFYSDQEHGMPTQILDYISEGKIMIKKLPDTLKNCVPMLAFEIGKAVQEESERVILFGAYPVPELYRMLISYDKKLVSKLFSKVAHGEADKNENEAAKKHRPPKKPEKKETPKAMPKQAKDPFASDIFGNLFDSIDTGGEPAPHEGKAKPEDGQEGAKASKETASLQNAAEEPAPRRKAAEENSPAKKEEAEPQKKSSSTGEIKKAETDRPKQQHSAPSEKVKKEAAAENYKKVSRTFQELLSEVCQEPVTESNAHGVMMSLVESMNCSNKQMMKEVYQKKLYEYFPGQKAKYFWAKTGLHFETLADYMLK